MNGFIKIKTAMVWSIITFILTGSGTVFGVSYAYGKQMQGIADTLSVQDKALADHDKRIREIETGMASVRRIPTIEEKVDHLIDQTAEIRGAIRGPRGQGDADMDNATDGVSMSDSGSFFE